MNKRKKTSSGLVELVVPWMKNLFIVDDPKSKKDENIERERERERESLVQLFKIGFFEKMGFSKSAVWKSDFWKNWVFNKNY